MCHHVDCGLGDRDEDIGPAQQVLQRGLWVEMAIAVDSIRARDGKTGEIVLLDVRLAPIEVIGDGLSAVPSLTKE